MSPETCLLEHPRALPSDEGLRDTPAVDSLILASPLSKGLGPLQLVREPTLSPDEYDDASRLLSDRINEFRSNRGLQRLSDVESLAEVALRHSEDMRNRGFFDHVNPDGLSPQDRVEAAGLRDYSCGENLFQLTSATSNQPSFIAEEGFTGWLNSPGHLANMKNRYWDTGGIGIYIETKLLLGDLYPIRYDIYVTHVLCTNISEYNLLRQELDQLEGEVELLQADYDMGEAEYSRLLEEYEAIQSRYREVEEQYVDNQVPFSDVETAFAEVKAAEENLNSQTDVLNAKSGLLNSHVDVFNTTVDDLNRLGQELGILEPD